MNPRTAAGHPSSTDPSAVTPLHPHEVSYPTRSPDTDPKAETVQLEIYRRMPSSRKIELVFKAIEMSRSLALAGIKSRHPQASSAEIQRRLFGLWLGEELATKVYGPLEESTAGA